MRHLSWRPVLIAVAVAALLAPASAAAKASPAEIASSRTKGVEYLKAQQKAGGEIPGFGGDWSLTAFAAAAVAPADVDKGGGGSTDARSWYEGVVGPAGWPGGEPLATDFERATLISYAAGIDPARVSKRQNLIARIASYYQPASPGYYGSTFNGTVFGLLALAGAKTTGGVQRVPGAVLDEAVAAVEANQHNDGGWTWEKAAGSEGALAKPSEPDMTGAAMAALCAAGVGSGATPIVDAKNYLASILEGSTGAFASAFGANTSSTAWAVDGLKACGIDPQGAEFTGTKTPIEFLISQQLSKGGGFKYLPGGSSAEMYSSQDAVRALEVCSVTVAPKAAATTLAAVLNAAVAGTTPAGCVSGFLPGSGEGAITQVNGYPATPAAKWNVSIDGGAEVQATRGTQIKVGDTIHLSYE